MGAHALSILGPTGWRMRPIGWFKPVVYRGSFANRSINKCVESGVAETSYNHIRYDSTWRMLRGVAVGARETPQSHHFPIRPQAITASAAMPSTAISCRSRAF